MGLTLREPLLWFFLLAGVLFALAPRSRAGDELHLSNKSLGALELAEARRRHVRELPAAVAESLRAQAIDDELLYREGLRLGVDRNDNVIRQRVIEKMLFLAEDLGGGAQPVSDGALQEYLQAHAGDFRRAASVSFIHVFAGDAGRLAQLRPGLPGGVDGDAATPPPVGDAFPIGRRVVDLPFQTVEKSYGVPFADALRQLPLGEWSAPIRSPYGFHLVKALARSDGSAPEFVTVREAVRAAYLQERKARATADFLRSIHERHPVIVDDAPGALPVGASARPTVAD